MKILRSINVWHFIWIIMIIAEAMTALLNSVQSILFYGHISYDLLRIGAIDAFVVSCVATPVAIYFIKNNRELAENNEMLVAALSDLRQSEEKRKLLIGAIESLPLGITITDYEGMIVYTNSTEAEIHGYTKEELLGHGASKLGPEKNDASVHRDVMSSWDKWKRETTNVRKSGEIFPVQLTSSVLKDEAGTPVGFVTACEDITERKQLQDRVLQAKAEWEHTFNTINEAITVHDRDFNIILANKAAEDLLQLPTPVIYGQKCFASYHATGCPPDNCPSCQTLMSCIPSASRLFEPHLNKHIEIKAFPRIDRTGQSIGVVHVVSDITRQVKAEEHLKRVYEMNRQILDHSPFGIYVCNSRGIVEYVNPAMLTISGDTHDQFIGVNTLDFASYHEIGLSAKIREAVSGVPFFLGPVEYRSKYGRKMTIRNFTGIPLEDNGQRKVLLFVEDISARVRSEDERKKLEDHLRHAQKIDAIGQLAGGVAHDFNNILSAIVGYTHLTLMAIPHNDELQRNLHQILQATDRASTLTKSLLSFSRKQIIDPRPISLNGLVQKQKYFLSRLIREDIQITSIFAEDDLQIFADSGQIEQVLMNLVTNARDAMPEGGQITIRTEAMQMDGDFVLAQGYGRVGKYALLTVSDTGVGMDERTRERIFEPFFTTKEQGKGTGLGLSMVYGIVKQHHGYITVCSEPARGTTLKVYLPLLSGIEEEEQACAVSQPLRGGAETILIAEDDEALRMLTSTILRNYGYRVVEAIDGEEAAEKYRQNIDRIQLSILDGIMPKKNGKEVFEDIRSMNPSAKAIFMSGYSEDIISKGGNLDGGINFLVKPVAPSDLLKQVRAVLDVTPHTPA